MPRRNADMFHRLRVIADLCILLFVSVLWHRLYLNTFEFTTERLLVLLAMVGVTYVVFTIGGVYSSIRGITLLEEVRHLFIRTVAVTLIVGLFAFLSKVAGDVSRMWFGWSMIFSFAGFVVFRAASRPLLNRLRNLVLTSALLSLLVPIARLLS